MKSAHRAPTFYIEGKMKILPMAESSCCGGGEQSPCCPPGDYHEVGKPQGNVPVGDVCCGGPPPPKSDPFERAGYTLCPYVRAFKRVGEDFVPLVATTLSAKDKRGACLVRLGANRESYMVSPGLYGVGDPGPDSPVIVTANYKLTFDTVRSNLQDMDAWLLVLDTCGINVWCAAGKKTFSTAEIVQRLQLTGLEEKVNHRKLIVPQLGATGVSAREVKKLSGFSVVYGPVRANDLKKFIDCGLVADPAMRLVTFSLPERLVLIPVEFTLFSKKVWWVLPILMVISGIGPWIFSLSQVWERGGLAVAAILLGTVSGAMLVPFALPWIPGRSFALKGAIAGLVVGGAFFFSGLGSLFERISIIGCVVTLSSYLAMNFTGSTPFTSPSGVEKEMKRAIPFQAVALFCSLCLWLAAPFIG
jgi:hypothetical protein